MREGGRERKRVRAVEGGARSGCTRDSDLAKKIKSGRADVGRKREGKGGRETEKSGSDVEERGQCSFTQPRQKQNGVV